MKAEEELKGVFTVSLDKKLVKDVFKLINPYGGKLSPVVNSLLTDWVEKQKNPDIAKEEPTKRSKTRRWKV